MLCALVLLCCSSLTNVKKLPRIGTAILGTLEDEGDVNFTRSGALRNPYSNRICTQHLQNWREESYSVCCREEMHKLTIWWMLITTMIVHTAWQLCFSWILILVRAVQSCTVRMWQQVSWLSWLWLVARQMNDSSQDVDYIPISSHGYFKHHSARILSSYLRRCNS